MQTKNDKGGKLQEPFPLVCIGMSAGGLEPLTTIFQQLNPRTGMAFVVIHHVSHFSTNLPSLISACTKMPVQFIVTDQSILPNHVYVLPSGEETEIRDNHFSLEPRSKAWGWANVISVFLESLAKSRHHGIAIILSGLDGDGAEALEDFRRNGGITIAQEPKSCANPEMPEAAIETGYVDYILPPDQIATQLEAISRN